MTKGKRNGLLSLPSVLQHELGLGGGSAPAPAGGGGKGGILSRKEKRKQERLEKKQRKVTATAMHHQLSSPPQLLQKKRAREIDIDEGKVTGEKRPRGTSNTSNGKINGAAGVRKSLGLVERAQAAARGGKRKEKKEPKKKKSSPALLAVTKDPYIAAEEEELRYLEKKLGLTGKNKEKKEEKLFRDLMRYEGFDDSICDLIKATDRISQIVNTSSCSASSKEKRKTKSSSMSASAGGGSKLKTLLLARQKHNGEEEEQDWNYEADLGSPTSSDGEDDDEEDGEDDDGGRGGYVNEGGIPDFLESDEDDEEEKDELDPLEVEMLDDLDNEDQGEEQNQQEEDEEEEEEEEEEDDDDDEESESEEEEEDEDEYRESKEVEKYAYRPVQGEDIYGRPINAADGDKGGGKYIPPHLRHRQAQVTAAADDDTTSEEYQRLRKVLNGLINRLSETNLQPTIRDVRALYSSNSSQRVNTLLTEMMLRLCVSSTQVMKALIPVYAALVAGCHFTGGGGVGAFVLERLCREYDERRKKMGALEKADKEGKEIGQTKRKQREEEEEEESLAREADNIVLLLAYLYAYGVVACGLVYELIRELVQRMGERDVELLLLLLRAAGGQLRGDDPAALKAIVLSVQERAGQIESEAGTSSSSSSSTFNARVRHMLETINDLKNNKRRQAQMQDQERTTRLRKLVAQARSSQRGSCGGETLHISWKDLRASDERGRWWRVGASWVGNGQVREEDEPTRKKATTTTKRMSVMDEQAVSLQDKIASLASKQRMNTDVRRAIFCAIMTATDYEDAFEKLMRLNLSDQQEREIIRVLIDCAGQEAAYNPFYAYLAGRLCEYHDKYKFTLQLTFWDIFKLLDDSSGPGASMSTRRMVNLAKTLVHLFLKGWLSLAVLKVVDVTCLGPRAGIFFQHVFLALLNEEESTDDELLAVVQRVGSSKDPFTLTETIIALLRRYILGSSNEGEMGGSEEGALVRSKGIRKRAKSLVKLLDKLSVSQFINSSSPAAGVGGFGAGGYGSDLDY